jgi:hypothetical protein
MIYFESKSMQFPRHSAVMTSKLVITNELTGDQTEVEFVNQSSDDRYYLIDLSDVELKDGTYRYQIGPEVGLMQVGDYVSQSTEYNENRSNKVYER